VTVLPASTFALAMIWIVTKKLQRKPEYSLRKAGPELITSERVFR